MDASLHDMGPISLALPSDATLTEHMVDTIVLEHPLDGFRVQLSFALHDVAHIQLHALVARSSSLAPHVTILWEQ